MHRRNLLIGLAGLGLAPGMALRAQAPEKVPRIAILTFGSPANVRTRVEAFRKGMRERGYADSQVQYLLRSANGQNDLLRRLALEITREKVDVVLSASTITTQELLNVTRTLPIVMATGEDPVANRFVRSLARPDTNVTGLTSNALVHVPRFVELISLAVPRLTRVAALANPENAIHPAYRSRLESAARSSRVTLTVIDATTNDEVENAFRRAAAARLDGVIVMSDGFFYNIRKAITELATLHRLPTVYPQQGYCDAGGLMSYGQNVEHNYFRAASYVDRILKGANPGELPIEEPPNHELVVNRQAARAIDLTLSRELLRRADRVIG